MKTIKGRNNNLFFVVNTCVGKEKKQIEKKMKHLKTICG
jgi:hypothetical protein